MTRRLVAPIAGVIVAALLAIAGWWWWYARTREPQRPTDSELRDLVHAHPAELTELRSMIGEDANVLVVGFERVGDCWMFPEGWSCNGFHPEDEAAMLQHVGLARARWATYRELLGRIGARSISRDRGGDVTIDVFAQGIVTSGTTKGLRWTERRPSPLVEDTDRDRPARFATTYAAAGDGWYIEQTTN